MRIIPFFLDFSPKARLIRKIRPDDIHVGILDEVAHMMKDERSKLSVDDFQEIWTRSDRAIKASQDRHVRDILNDILRDARWEVQLWHRQYRYR